jgi:hypothetical protein
MSESPRALRPSHLMGLLAFCLALFFLIAYANKTVETFQLARWKAHLASEVEQMERQKEDLLKELARRDAPEWPDQLLREAGYVPAGVQRVIAVPATPARAAAVATPIPSEPSAPQSATGRTQWFHNPNWDAWKRLVMGAD